MRAPVPAPGVSVRGGMSPVRHRQGVDWGREKKSGPGGALGKRRIPGPHHTRSEPWKVIAAATSHHLTPSHEVWGTPGDIRGAAVHYRPAVRPDLDRLLCEQCDDPVGPDGLIYCYSDTFHGNGPIWWRACHNACDAPINHIYWVDTRAIASDVAWASWEHHLPALRWFARSDWNDIFADRGI